MNTTKLQLLRKEKEISQFELAKRADVSIQIIQAYEQKRKPIEGCRISTLIKLANILGVPFYDLFDDKNILKSVLTNVNTYGIIVSDQERGS